MLDFITLKKKSDKTVNNVDMYDLLHKTFVIPDVFKYQVIKVTHDYEYRPDLIAKTLYGHASYADVICKLNGCCNVMEIYDGRKLIVPEFNSLDKFYYVENSETNVDVSGEDEEKSTQKTKSESRRANEQVTGDSNFRINKDSKIIIY